MKSQDQTDETMRSLIEAIKMRKEERVTKICQNLSSVKCFLMLQMRGLMKRRARLGMKFRLHVFFTSM